MHCDLFLLKYSHQRPTSPHLTWLLFLNSFFFKKRERREGKRIREKQCVTASINLMIVSGSLLLWWKKNLRATFRRSFSVSTLPTSSFFFPVVCWEEMQLILYTHHLVGRRETKEYAVSIGQGMNSTALICRFLLPARLSFPFTSEHAFLSNLFFKKKEKKTHYFVFVVLSVVYLAFKHVSPLRVNTLKAKS